MQRLYSLFARERGDGKWVRASVVALPKAQAVVYFQNALLTSAMGLTDVDRAYRLRPIKREVLNDRG